MIFMIIDNRGRKNSTKEDCYAGAIDGFSYDRLPGDKEVVEEMYQPAEVREETGQEDI